MECRPAAAARLPGDRNRVSVRRDARHEHVPAQLVSAAARRAFDVGGGRSFRPIVGDIDYCVELAIAEHARHRGQIASFGPDVVNLRAEIVLVAAVQDGDVMPAL
jgi:hypothetical protein